MSKRFRLVAMLSGSGSNLLTLIKARAAGTLDVDIVHVIANRENAGGLNHARDAGIPCSVISQASADERDSTQDELVAERLRDLSPDLILLTGYMRILGAELVTEFTGRMINQHPSLLPQYKGLNTYARALAAGDRQHGASVHFVTPELDGGPVIAQAKIDIQTTDTPASLQQRLAPVEHQLLINVMELFIDGRVTHSDNGVIVDGLTIKNPLIQTNEKLKHQEH